MGLQIQMILNAATIGEIDAAFASVARERADALFVAPDIFYVSRAVQFATLTATQNSGNFWNPDHVAAGGLMSYGTDVADTFRQVGVYTGTPRRREGRRPSGAATDQIRVRHQSSNGASARRQRAARTARSRRRSDRMRSAASSSRCSAARRRRGRSRHGRSSSQRCR